ncbi:hypothetical protein P7C71_g4008, partial [Lecanoromycetidae sp. Uapishka_2]
MDGLSVAASIMAVLDLTAEVMKYAKEAKDASAERSRLLKDVINIKASLHSLQNHVETPDPNEPWMRAVQGFTKPGGPLKVYKAALEHLLEKLSPLHIDGKRTLVKRLGSSLPWPFQASEVSEIPGICLAKWPAVNLHDREDAADSLGQIGPRYWVSIHFVTRNGCYLMEIMSAHSRLFSGKFLASA